MNEVFTDISYTMKAKRNKSLPVLEVFVAMTSIDKLETSVCRESTYTDQISQFYSNHPKCHKRSCIKTLGKRGQSHCSQSRPIKGNSAVNIGKKMHTNTCHRTTALRVSSQPVMKVLQPNCPTQRTNQCHAAEHELRERKPSSDLLSSYIYIYM